MDGQGLDPLFLTVFSSPKYIGGRLGWVLITIFGFMTFIEFLPKCFNIGA